MKFLLNKRVFLVLNSTIFVTFWGEIVLQNFQYHKIGKEKTLVKTLRKIEVI
jgi:hypothetical protein